MKKCYYYVATIFDSNPSGVIDGVLSTKDFSLNSLGKHILLRVAIRKTKRDLLILKLVLFVVFVVVQYITMQHFILM